jgi:hypothetical protein
LEPEEPPGAPEPEVEQEHSQLLRRVEALVELSRKERERLELQEEPTGEDLPPEL